MRGVGMIVLGALALAAHAATHEEDLAARRNDRPDWRRYADFAANFPEMTGQHNMSDEQFAARRRENMKSISHFVPLYFGLLLERSLSQDCLPLCNRPGICKNWLRLYSRNSQRRLRRTTR